MPKRKRRAKRAAARAHARKAPSKRQKPKRVDWTKKPAPPKGSKARPAYEKSAVYRARKRAAAKSQETRRKNAAREQRRLAREERIAVAKEHLSPLLAKVISDWRSNRPGWNESRESHANWYQSKVGFGNVMRSNDFVRVLEELSLEHDLDELGWDIVY